MAESVNGLYKTECIRPEGPWRTAEQLELATLLYVEWSRYAAHPRRDRRPHPPPSSKPSTTVTTTRQPSTPDPTRNG